MRCDAGNSSSPHSAERRTNMTCLQAACKACVCVLSFGGAGGVVVRHHVGEGESKKGPTGDDDGKPQAHSGPAGTVMSCMGLAWGLGSARMRSGRPDVSQAFSSDYI